MSGFLGIDTSNYTTSAAFYDGCMVIQKKIPLPVKQGQLGLRQSDAVFHHVQQLPQAVQPLLRDVHPRAVGVSARPRDQEGSYMPCFTVGLGAAKMLAAAWGVPCYEFSHQAGHIAAALYSAGRLDLLERRFLAFHVSGGTTEAVLVHPHSEQVIGAEIVASSLDLKGGQAIDRVGVMLGLPFPAGPRLEEMAKYSRKRFTVRPSMKGADCSLSGIENKCSSMYKQGDPPEDVARYCLDAILAALDAMCGALLEKYGDLPVLFAGGVTSNTLLREALSEKYGALFAQPAFSSDNATGAAVLASVMAHREGIA